jgi:putative aminopeptidase FrvX
MSTHRKPAGVAPAARALDAHASAQLLCELSCAHGIAGHEGEVRTVIKQALATCGIEPFFDGLGSMIYRLPAGGLDAEGGSAATSTSAASAAAPKKILLCAHLDEVGFITRSISPEGILWLLPVGGVKANAKEMQLVHVLGRDGTHHQGILNCRRDSAGNVGECYVDLGVDSDDEVRALGVAEGAPVTFATTATTLGETRVLGKALDDRAGCLVLIQTLLSMVEKNLKPQVDIYFAFTTSEEVGTRGGRTCAQLIQPDAFIAVDVANHPELDRGFKNHRKLGAGPMIELYDKTMVPNAALLDAVRAAFTSANITWQEDMFGGGGTDAAQAHLTGGGIPSCVVGVPLRYCHGPASLADLRDAFALRSGLEALLGGLTPATMNAFTSY